MSNNTQSPHATIAGNMGTQSPPEDNRDGTPASIPLALIDEPQLPERETMEEELLADLALDIKTNGLIQPIVVKPVGDRFEVIAGHRRLLACRMVQYDPVECIVRSKHLVDPLRLLVAENAEREAVNPVEEARFFQRVLEEHCENDVDVLCIKLRRKRLYVEDRLNLLRGWPQVVEALHQRKISMAAARELNKCHDPLRMVLLLDQAANQGATARAIAEWRKQGELIGPVGEAPPQDPRVGDAANGAPYTSGLVCLFCEDSDDPHLMELIYLHRPCKKIILKMLGRIQEGNPQQS